MSNVTGVKRPREVYPGTTTGDRAQVSDEKIEDDIGSTPLAIIITTKVAAKRRAQGNEMSQECIYQMAIRMTQAMNWVAREFNVRPQDIGEYSATMYTNRLLSLNLCPVLVHIYVLALWFVVHNTHTHASAEAINKVNKEWSQAEKATREASEEVKKQQHLEGAQALFEFAKGLDLMSRTTPSSVTSVETQGG